MDWGTLTPTGTRKHQYLDETTTYKFRGTIRTKKVLAETFATSKDRHGTACGCSQYHPVLCKNWQQQSAEQFDTSHGVQGTFPVTWEFSYAKSSYGPVVWLESIYLTGKEDEVTKFGMRPQFFQLSYLQSKPLDYRSQNEEELSHIMT